MILNFEIDEETGAKLDALAATEHRSRRQQATKLLLDAIEMVIGDSLEPLAAHHASPAQPEEAEA